MIRLQKGDEPAVLARQKNTWLQELRDALASGDKKRISNAKSKYNSPAIKSAVIRETFGKCAYCEGEVRAVAHGDIEHISPKSLDYDVTFVWSNLTFSCQLCNQSKSDKDPLHNNIIDPYNEDPSDYLRFVGPLINGKGTDRGRMTISCLSLDRAELNERRLEAHRQLMKSIEIIQIAKTPEQKSLFIRDFEQNELVAQKEFLAMKRDIWAAIKDDL